MAAHTFGISDNREVDSLRGSAAETAVLIFPKLFSQFSATNTISSGTCASSAAISSTGSGSSPIPLLKDVGLSTYDSLDDEDSKKYPRKKTRLETPHDNFAEKYRADER